MDELKQLQLKANDGKAYQFTTANNNSKQVSSRFETLQLARLHIDKFARLRPQQGADLLAVLGMLDFPAEVQARTGGRRSFANAREILAKALFDGKLRVHEVPAIEPVVVHQPSFAEKGVQTTKQVATQGGKEEKRTVGKGSVSDAPIPVCPDEMEYCGDPVSMATGEEILQLTDITLSGSMPICWQRLYRSSLCQQNVGLGYGWRSNFHFELTKIQLADGEGEQWHFIDNKGSILAFDDIAVGAVSYQLTAGAALFHDPHGYYLLTLSDGRQLRFVYQHQRWLLERLRENETLQYRFGYSSAGRLTSIVANGCQTFELRYDVGGNLIEVQLLVGIGSTPTVLAHYHYSTEGDLCEASNRQQQVESYQYTEHLLTRRIRPSGFSHYFEWQGKGSSSRCITQWGDEGNYQYCFDYDIANHTAVSTDSMGNQWRYEHNTQGKLIRKVSPKGHVWRYRYDAKSRKVAETTPGGATTNLRYNHYGQLSEIQAPDNSVTHYSYNRMGQVIRIVDGENREWRNDYNSFGRLLSQQDPAGVFKQFHYDRHGRVIHIEQSNGRSQRYWWNEHGLLAAAQDGEAITRYSYDELGEINGIINSDGWVTQYKRERSGLIVEIAEYPQTNPEQQRSQRIDYDWAGRPTVFMDSIGRAHTFVYQGLAQPVQHIRPDGSWLKFQYDKERNLTAIERSDGVTYQLDYDSEELIRETVGFDGRTQQYQYDGQGLLISLAEQGERFIQLRRDNCGRVIEQHCSAAGISLSNHFQYDNLGRLLRANNARRKLSIRYHLSGHPSEIWQDNWQLQHEYDTAGRRTCTQLPDNHQIHYRYNKQGLLAGIDWDQQPLIDRQFDTSRREVSRLQSNGVTFSQSFDIQGRLQQQCWKHAHTEQQRGYRYNQADQLVGIHDSEQGEIHYQFDQLDQLTQSQLPHHPEELFNFDSFGNPQSEQSSQQGNKDIHVSRDRLLQWQDTHYSYDRFGNQTKSHTPQGNEQRRFNGFNQLTSLKKNSKYTQYYYDALGRRSAKITESQRIDFLWDGDQLIGEHCNDQYNWYIYEPNSFRPVALIKKGQVYYYHLDHLGTPLTLTDSRGETVWQAEYSIEGLASPVIESINNPLRFQGQYYDDESGLHYNRFRYYDPKAGRFIHQDPIGLLGGINPYQYAPNPVQWVDPLGLSCKEGKASNGITLPSGKVIYPLENIVTSKPVDRGFLLNTANSIVEDVPLVGDVLEGIGNQIGYYRSGLREDGLKLNPFTGNQLTPLDEQTAVFDTITAGLGSATGKLAPGFAKNVVPEGVELASSSRVVRELPGGFDDFVPNKINMWSPDELMGVEPASPELISAVSRKRDVVIAQSDSEELRMLDYFGAEASVGGVDNTHILLRENPSKPALLEEFLHGTQVKLGITERLGTSGFGSAETHVKDFMIRHQSMLGLSDEDIKILQILRDKGL
ncbi:RHS repeat-associated core domain-containing protein [Photobacterium chitinilyticum]|uniref:RHS repeat protein n=1 Tax=Photobacterium chitinilyticum TaxID=2485123 RepID=A0A444JVY9_9GAMM|nr:RHS repeat-associated core domain-containing protein [Photobacterium chitinilyticum]RWX57244.1 RHS repeat protein [Photobacterium chitinilyticum]